MSLIVIFDISVRPIIVLPRITGNHIQSVDAPVIVITGIGLKNLASAQILSLDISSYTQVDSVGVGLE